MSKENKEIILPKEASIALSIKNPEDMTKAVSILSVLNKALDHLTEEKEKMTKPINVTLKEIRARFKPYETKLEAKITEIRGEMIKYQTKQVAIQQKKEADLAQKVAEGKISIEKAADKINQLPGIATKTETDNGSVKFKPVKCFEISDISALPLEYHLANEVKIRAAMNEGKELPGVKYWVEQRPYNSR